MLANLGSVDDFNVTGSGEVFGGRIVFPGGGNTPLNTFRAGQDCGVLWTVK